jgi:Mg-chelatase subunit ChlD
MVTTGRNLQSFHTAAERFARMHGRKQNIHVRFSGQEAYTDGTTVNLPHPGAGSVITREQELVLWGYIDHEVGHIQQTDMIHWMKEAPQLVKSGPNGMAIKALWNLIEDVRMEMKVIERYPGSQFTLDYMSEYVDRKHPATGSAYSRIYSYLFATHRGMKWHDPTVIDHPKMAQAKDILVTEFPQARNSRDTLQLAMKIFVALPVGEEFPIFEQGEDKDSQIQEMILEMLEIDVQSDPGEKRRGKEASAGTGNKALPPRFPQSDHIFYEAGNDLQAYKDTIAVLHPEIRALSNGLRLRLAAQRRHGYRIDQEEGFLDQERLASLSLGENRVFMHTRTRRLISTAVQVMIDLSGSMNKQRVIQMAALLAEALFAIREIKVGIAGFRTGDYRRLSTSNALETTGYGRIEPLRVPIIKKFDDGQADARARIGALNTDGGTPLGDGYAYGMEALIDRREERKILWLVSDGAPSYSVCDDEHSDRALLLRTHQRCKRYGIETHGIFIADSAWGRKMAESLLRECTDRVSVITGSGSTTRVLLDTMGSLVTRMAA